MTLTIYNQSFCSPFEDPLIYEIPNAFQTENIYILGVKILEGFSWAMGMKIVENFSFAVLARNFYGICKEMYRSGDVSQSCRSSFFWCYVSLIFFIPSYMFITVHDWTSYF